MRRNELLFLALVATLATAQSAAAQSKAVFQDKGGNMAITDYSDWKITRTGPGAWQFVFRGDSVKGAWQQQRLTIESPNIEGKAEAGAKGVLRLVSASMSSGVRATMLRRTSLRNSTEDQTVAITGRSASYEAGANRLDVAGGIKIVNSDPASKRSMTMTGSAASVVLASSATTVNRDGVESATIVGPVTFEIEATQQVVDSKTKKTSQQATTIVGKADRLEYSAKSRTLVLIGNVEITGTDTIFGAEIKGISKATITFDENHEPIDIEMKGSPGVSKIRDLQKGTGAGK